MPQVVKDQAKWQYRVPQPEFTRISYLDKEKVRIHYLNMCGRLQPVLRCHFRQTSQSIFSNLQLAVATGTERPN